MSVIQIKQIEDLIVLPPGKKITSHKVHRLTAPGENYGSLMLGVDISVQTPQGNEGINAVAKMVPPNDFIQELFNTQVTFPSEIAFYKKIVPLLQEFQREHGVKEVIDFVPEYYGSRLNLKNDESKVDINGALVLENLKASGYTTLERLDGLDLHPAKLVLENLAQLHAVSLAFRLHKPGVFQKEILPFLSQWSLKSQQHENMKNQLNKLIDKIPEIQPLRERVLNGFERLKEKSKIRETFATIVHNDSWTNNNMFQIKDGKVVKNKMVDYQIMDYSSPAKDVVFFIFSSVKSEVVKQSYEELLKFYHDTFVTTLKELDCDVSKYSYEAFLEEVEYEGKNSQAGHLMFMLSPIYAPRGTVSDISELNSENMEVQEITDIQKEKYVFVFNDLAKRNWI